MPLLRSCAVKGPAADSLILFPHSTLHTALSLSPSSQAPATELCVSDFPRRFRVTERGDGPWQVCRSFGSSWATYHVRVKEWSLPCR